jgi:hypothetical protein
VILWIGAIPSKAGPACPVELPRVGLIRAPGFVIFLVPLMKPTIDFMIQFVALLLRSVSSRELR